MRRRPRQRRRQSHILGEGRADDKVHDRARHHRIRTKVFGPPSLVHRSHRPLRRRRALPRAAGAQHSAFTGILANTSPVPVANKPLPNTPSSILACSNAVSGSNDVVFVDARHDASPPRRALPSRRRVASRRRPTITVPSRARDTRASMARIASTSRARGRTTSGRGLDASSPEGVKPYGTRTPLVPAEVREPPRDEKAAREATPSWSLTRSEWTLQRASARERRARRRDR